jgi:tRNA threonylcarbamoyl adenosine modification protein YeaZ
MTSGVLAIDTVSSRIAVGFARGDNPPVVRVHDGPQDHTRVLLGLVDDVCGGDRGAIGAIVVVRGPGGYTGVRVGLAAAHGLGVALGMPVHGVDTLAAVVAAARTRGAKGRLRAIHPAGRGDFAVQEFDDATAPGRLSIIAGDGLHGTDLAGEAADGLSGTTIGAVDRCLAAITLYEAGVTTPAEAMYVREPHITVATKTPIRGVAQHAPTRQQLED